MKEKIREIMWNFVAGEVTDSEAVQQVLDLFAVSGSALHDKVVKQIPDEYKEQISKTIKKHYR